MQVSSNPATASSKPYLARCNQPLVHLSVIPHCMLQAYHSLSVTLDAPPQDMSNLLYAFARLGHKPPAAWLAAFLAAAAAQLPLFNEQNASNTIWALAKLSAPPPADWTAAFLAHTHAGLPTYGQQVNNLLTRAGQHHFLCKSLLATLTGR